MVLSKKDKKKIVIVIVAQLMLFMFILLPIVIPAGVAGGVIHSIFSFFTSAGKYGIPEEKVEEIRTLLSNYKTTDEYNRFFAKVRTVADKANIKYSRIIIPILFANEIESKEVDKWIDEAATIAANNTNSDSNLVIELKLQPLFKDKLKDFTDTHIVQSFEKFEYLFDSDAPLSSSELEKVKDSQLIYPLRKKAIVTSEFGERSIILKGKPFNAKHTGIDLAYGDGKTCGVTIYAAQDGVVYDVEKKDAEYKSYYVYIKNEQFNLRTAYLHLQKPPLWNKGDKIKKGDVIGLIGTTGLSTGCHLHFQVGTLTDWYNPRKAMNFDNPTLP